MVDEKIIDEKLEPSLAEVISPKSSMAPKAVFATAAVAEEKLSSEDWAA